MPIDEKVAEEAKRQQQTLSELPLGEERVVQRIGCTSPVPKGWIKINDHWSPTSCGNPTQIVYNVCTIEKYSDKPVGAEMDVCADAPTPEGWADIDTFWSPTRCGRPTSIVHNMKRIHLSATDYGHPIVHARG